MLQRICFAQPDGSEKLGSKWHDRVVDSEEGVSESGMGGMGGEGFACACEDTYVWASARVCVCAVRSPVTHTSARTHT
jgi:hypothetical protein